MTINVCKHYGTHTCVVETKGKMDKHNIESVHNKYPKLTHETIVRQDVQSILEKKNYKTTVELSQKYTDTSYIYNIRKGTLLSKRSDDHSFRAVKILKDKFDTEDKYLIFDCEFNERH